MEKELIKITELVNQLGLSSRSLRYYEQVGLIRSTRPEFEKYRYYDAENIERLKQIIVLRKMQIPIKDIIRIYESEDMSTVVEVFVNRIHEIDKEVGALSELKRVVCEFLQTMLTNGIKKISAIPLLYEEMDKQLELLEERRLFSYDDLSGINDLLAKPIEPAIVLLPSMRVISSLLIKNPKQSDATGFWRWVQSSGISPGRPGQHEQFEYQINDGAGSCDVIILKVSDNYINDSQYFDYAMDSGLYASMNVYLDEDLGEKFRSLVSSFDSNKFYEINYYNDGSGGLRHHAMIESLISPDDKRELVALLVPVKRRMADPSLFGVPEEVTGMEIGTGAGIEAGIGAGIEAGIEAGIGAGIEAGMEAGIEAGIEAGAGISIAEIEAANPVLWEVDVPLDKLIPINGPNYRTTEEGEAEYIAWISTRVLSTNIAVKLPFRVDVEFRVREESMQFAWGADEGNIRIYHGSDLNFLFGINMETNPDERLSQEAICFHQPIFRDYFCFPKRGRINKNEYNRLTWIVGEKHLAVIINNEIRYCGINFPYMAISADWDKRAALPIIIGSNGQSTIFFKSIRVSQLERIQKSKIKEGELIMATKQSNNTIPNIHRFIISEHGENYHFNGCARYVMESIGKYTVDSDLMTEGIYNLKEVDTGIGYWFFAGLTGDIFAQVYSYNDYLGECVSSYMFNSEGGGYFERIFEKCGYASTFVSGKQLSSNKEMYIQTLMAYIDKGMPVIAVTHGGPPWGIYVGYEEHGNTLLFLAGDNSEPERVPIELVIPGDVDMPQHVKASSSEIHAAKGWIFIGEMKRAIDVAQAYRKIVFDMPRLLTTKTDDFCFGAEAFRAWASDIENGKFDNVKPEDFDGWGAHVSNICNMATNGSCAHNSLKRAQGLNPDMTFLDEINKLYERTAKIWNDDGGADLEALGGGFNVTLDALQDKVKRGKIAAKIREAATCIDEIVRIIELNTPK